ncbi:hypothetical protein GCM10011489_25090 [Gordonia jinhuaensis]|uniref:Uncharacterized protein n=2 Tax=Gordonia jinhuaensis TaxID=1517702 RepID=A0A916T8V5_9ACTN|nr:hypothetical protein GCM10011489_25090 [Gordonia jinhuaensis]
MSKVMTCAGAVLIIACVAYFMVRWADEGRWPWMIFGAILIALNVFVLFNELKPRPKPRDWTVEEVREVIAPIVGDAAQVRTLRRVDKGLSLPAALELVQKANSTSAED